MASLASTTTSLSASSSASTRKIPTSKRNEKNATGAAVSASSTSATEEKNVNTYVSSSDTSCCQHIFVPDYEAVVESIDTLQSMMRCGGKDHDDEERVNITGFRLLRFRKMKKEQQDFINGSRKYKIKRKKGSLEKNGKMHLKKLKRDAKRK